MENIPSNKNLSKISICTVCMNRLHHLRLTLEQNMLDNADYPNLEFILLDYNSTDGLDEYIRTNFQDYIVSGRLIYFKTIAPTCFNRSHSRNVAFKMATGDIICNVDADNYTGPGFASYVSRQFENSKAIILTATGQEGKNTDVLGRICLRKRDFDAINGFDERFCSYGFEDSDLVNRLVFKGLEICLIRDEKYLQALAHDDKQRLSNEYMSRHLDSILACYLTPARTDFVFLFDDLQFKKGTLTSNEDFVNPKLPDDQRLPKRTHEHSILQDTVSHGSWARVGGMISLFYDGGHVELLGFCDGINCFVRPAGNAKAFYYTITNEGLIQKAVMLFSQITNRMIMEDNRMNRRISVNQVGYGSDTLFKNFSWQDPIII